MNTNLHSKVIASDSVIFDTQMKSKREMINTRISRIMLCTSLISYSCCLEVSRSIIFGLLTPRAYHRDMNARCAASLTLKDSFALGDNLNSPVNLIAKDRGLEILFDLQKITYLASFP